jgi:hypothetical protein
VMTTKQRGKTHGDSVSTWVRKGWCRPEGRQG